MTADADTLRIALAEKLGWTEIENPVPALLLGRTGIPPGGKVDRALPDLDSLVRQAEAGLSEEQQGRYAMTLLNGGYALPNLGTAIMSPIELFKLITKPPEDRAKALLTVL